LIGIFLKLEPKPVFPVEFLAAVASNYNAWSEVAESIEKIALNMLDHPDNEAATVAMEVLQFMLTDADDRDSASALCRMMSNNSTTAIALSLETYGFRIEAQQALLSGIRNITSDTSNGISSPASVVLPVSSLELSFWESRWIQSAKELSQWSALADYASSLQLSDLGTEVASMKCDWEGLRLLRATPAVAAQLARGSPSHKLFDVMLAIADGKLPEADRQCAQAAQMSLLRWQLLPPLCGGSRAHRQLLHLFHRVIELRESAGMMGEAAKALRCGKPIFIAFSRVLV